MDNDSKNQVAQQVAVALRERDEKVAVAESSTGGLIGSKLTSVEGASSFFDSSVAVYSYDSKRRLGVEREVLDAEGAVSGSVARQMARRVRDMSDVTWGLATTGIAGPGGGKPEEGKPVGTVFIAVAYAGEWGTQESYTTVERREYDGAR
ncbi:MAG: CinA family protein, partial [Halobacteria archaeon]|nr:CinA family protein [Halobacteria archaeon]